MARVLKPPSRLDVGEGERSVFLAGSIDMGRAAPWQPEVERALGDLPIAILNPRRDDWDSTWVQSIDNAQFRGQVEWELDAQERASVIAMYFAPGSQAPITLMELGLFVRTGKLVVCCPEGFWRRGNVQVVCNRYRVPMADDLDGLVRTVREWVGG
jgi:hypothetical protein